MTSRLLTVFVLATAVLACKGNDTPTSPSVNANVPYSQTDVRVGTGTEAVNGRTVTSNYSLWLYSPTAAENKGQFVQNGPFPPFVLGSSNVIAGFNQMIVGMRVGGLRRAVIPPNLGYGAAGNPPAIPGNATIVFEVELLNVQ
jgi:FKBP-type peptidyl-prolyl cis-trans isomerase FkpA